MKCGFDGIEVRPDGVNVLDPCLYEDMAMYKNVTVIVSKCKRCSHIELSWLRQEDTEEISFEEN